MMKQSADELTSAELGALERLLPQIERSISHYDALKVEFAASKAEIAAAYQQGFAALLPLRTALETRGKAVAEVRERIERAISRLAQAYVVLSNPDKRGEYDRSLRGKGNELGLQLIGNDGVGARAAMRPEIAAPASDAGTHESRRGRERSKRILVVDDDLPMRRVLGKILTSAGYEVFLVEDGKEAVEKAAEVRPDLVITDGLMPKLHGFLVCKALKELQPAPKVIMLTAVYTKLNYRFEARDRYGADDLLTKPFEVANLLECIERHLGLMPRALAG